MEEALNRQPQARHKPRRLDGDAEAHLIATTCSSPPSGSARWTLRLLAEHLIELEQVQSISHETVRQILKKTNLNLGLSESWVIPPEASASFVCQMEDVLDVYKRPYNPQYPVVCNDYE